MTIDEKLRKTIENAYENAPATRARFDSAGLTPADIQTRVDLEKLPVLDKDAVVALQQADPPFGGMLAASMDDVEHIFFSPGPIYEPEVAGDDTTQFDMFVEAIRRAGFGKGDVVLNTLSYHLVPAGLAADEALRTLGCIVIPGGVGNSDLQVKMAIDLGANGYVGTPSFLSILLEKAETMGVSLGIVKGFFSAEPFPPTLRQTFVERGISCANGYGTAELGIIAVDTAGQMAMQLMPEPIIEIIDPDTGKAVGAGEVGEVVVTTFSQAYPLIRLGTGDMGVNFDPNPGESTQGERAVALVGRRGEAVKVRGMFVHPNQLRFAASQVGQVGGVQGVVTRPENRDTFVVRLVSAEIEKADAFKAVIKQICRVTVDDIEFVDAIEEGTPGMVDARSWE